MRYEEWIILVKQLLSLPVISEEEDEIFLGLFKDGWSVEKAADAYIERVGDAREASFYD